MRNRKFFKALAELLIEHDVAEFNCDNIQFYDDEDCFEFYFYTSGNEAHYSVTSKKNECVDVSIEVEEE